MSVELEVEVTITEGGEWIPTTIDSEELVAAMNEGRYTAVLLYETLIFDFVLLEAGRDPWRHAR